MIKQNGVLDAMFKKINKILLIIFSILTVISFSSCAKENANKEAQKYLQEAENETKDILENKDEIFLLKNETGVDIYSIDFLKDNEEPLEIDAVLPSGNEIFVNISGEWEIVCDFLENEQHIKKSFGKLNLDNAEIVDLKVIDGIYSAEIQTD